MLEWACTGAVARTGATTASTKPRNPRHFDGIEGGRKRVSDTVLTEIVTISAFREAQPLFLRILHFLASKHCLEHFSPRLSRDRVSDGQNIPLINIQCSVAPCIPKQLL